MGDSLEKLYESCKLCPRCCGVDRALSRGFCGAGTTPRLAKAMLHAWEEPALSPDGRSGAVFFSYCTMRCVFCQNYTVSAEGFGREISEKALSDIFFDLKRQGAENLDLVTPTHYLPSLIGSLKKVRGRLHIPVVYNCGGYERPQILRLLDGYVDIYLPDVKYFDDSLAVRYSSAPGYFRTCSDALGEMLRQTGPPVFEGGALKRGVIVRHMVLPGHRKDSIGVLNGLYARFGSESFLVSLLGQYTPFYRVKTQPAFGALNRRLTRYEYQSVVDEALRLGFKGFMQGRGAAGEEYTPCFDLQGLPL